MRDLDEKNRSLSLKTLSRTASALGKRLHLENPETPVDYLAEDLEIDSIALGILAARAFPNGFDDAEDECELNESALIAITDDLRKEVFQCLCKAYGDEVALYLRMCQTQPNPDTDAEEFTVTPGNCRGLEYVMNGFQE